MRDILPVVVDGLWRQGAKNLAVRLVSAEGQPLPAWTPGAHIDLHLPCGLIRQYSLTGSPAERDRYLLCIARESQSRGGSRYIHDTLRPGQPLMISAPRNHFPLYEGGHVVLLAAGIGITPLLAMAHARAASGASFTLHYYVKEHGNAAFARELMQFKHGECVIHTISPRTALAEHMPTPAPGFHAWVCGPAGFMEKVYQVALARGWAESNLHSEAFQPVMPADCNETGEIFTVKLASTGERWPVPADKTIAQVLLENGVVAIESIDTRAPTMHLREVGAQKAAISTEDLDPAHLLARVQASPNISEHNFVPDVSVDAPHVVPATSKKRFNVVAYDCGEKNGILQGLASNGCEVTVVPWNTPAEDALAYNPDGIFFSNGPGDPEQVDATQEAARGVLGKVTVFGICLGNQMLSIVAGADIEKLKFGHHGGNEPVMNLLTGKVEITAQNHNYGLVFPSLGKLIAEESGGISEHFDNLCEWSARRIAPVVQTKEFGRVRLTHVNLNDGTPEGIQFLDIPAFSVQYHPEASPGPHDSSYLFKAFARLMEGQSDYLAIDVREGRRF